MRSHSAPVCGRIGACPSFQRGKKERKCEKNERMERLISRLHIGALSNRSDCSNTLPFSWHCFNSFFAYTFFRWEQKHSQSHGVHVSNMTDDIEKIEITISKTDGVFQRTVDRWSCLGGNLAF
jgi:hypothetical protein